MRYELTDHEWSAIEPLLPNKSRGVPRADDSRVPNGIFGPYARAHRGAICPKASGRIPPL
jgi:transposase